MPLPKHIIHLLSGGLDSTVLLYDLLSQGCNVHCVLFDYGQRHGRPELHCARWHCKFRDVLFTEIQLPTIKGTSLTGDAGTKVVPNRNAIMLSHAISLASIAGAEAVTFACNKDDSNDFPDCRPEFVAAMNQASAAADTGVEVCAPYLDLTKKQIVNIGRYHGVNLEATYSCYTGFKLPCGICDACVLREKALAT